MTILGSPRGTDDKFVIVDVIVDVIERRVIEKVFPFKASCASTTTVTSTQLVDGSEC